MPTRLPSFLFLDEEKVDELWVHLKRDGIPRERVERATDKLSTQVKLGLGSLLKALGVDLSVGGSRSEDSETSVRKDFSAPLKLLLLTELLDGATEPLRAEDYQCGNIVEAECEWVQFFPLPTLASYIQQMALSGIQDTLDFQNFGKIAVGNSEQADAILKQADVVKAFTDQNRSLYFNMAQESFEPLGRILVDHSDLLLSILSVSYDDRMLVLAEVNLDGEDVRLVCVVREDKTARSAVALANGGPAKIFGHVIALNLDAQPRLIRLLPVAIRTRQ